MDDKQRVDWNSGLGLVQRVDWNSTERVGCGTDRLYNCLRTLSFILTVIGFVLL